MGRKRYWKQEERYIAIHNGADDNASGVSALLSILKEFSKSINNPRSIIFISFSGEEEGLLGSKYFVNHLPVDNNAVKVMINMDMVGRLNAEKQLYMGGAGTFPDGVELMKKLGEGSGLNPLCIAGDVEVLTMSPFTKNKYFGSWDFTLADIHNTIHLRMI